MARPLEGIRVLDFTHALAGPFCTYQLGLLGADVIKVERPKVGDDFRHYALHPGGRDQFSAPFVAANTGKRSIAMDLKAPGAREVVERLTARADVVVENFRPGVPKSLRLDYDSLQPLNPRLVYCSITGFGQIGPLRDWPAYDHIVQAISGITLVNGEPDQGPLKVGIPLSDTFAGVLAAYAILAALMQRTHTGTGQNIDVSMLDATMVLMAQIISGVTISGRAPVRTGNRGFRLVATSDTYATRDGYLAIGANHQHQVAALFAVLDRPDMLQDARFATDAARIANNDAMRAELTRILADRMAADLEGRLNAAQVPASRVRAVDEILAHPHVAEREVMVDAHVPGQPAPAAIVGAGFRFAHDGPRRHGTVPALGADADAILAEVGLTLAEVVALRAQGVI